MKILENITIKIKKFNSFFNGSKTNIGVAIILISMGLQAFFPEALTISQYNFFDTLGYVLSGIGLGHKGIKYVQIMKNKSKTINK